MKKRILAVMFVCLVGFILSGCGNQVSKDKAILGEWALSSDKTGTAAGISYLKFEEDGDFQWLLQNGTEPTTTLYDGKYIAADTLSIYIPGNDAIESEYSFDGKYLKLGEMYYEKKDGLSFIPTT